MELTPADQKELYFQAYRLHTHAWQTNPYQCVGNRSLKVGFDTKLVFNTVSRGLTHFAALDFDAHDQDAGRVESACNLAELRLRELGLSSFKSISSFDHTNSPRGFHLDLFFHKPQSAQHLRQAMRHFFDGESIDVWPSASAYRLSFLSGSHGSGEYLTTGDFNPDAAPLLRAYWDETSTNERLPRVEVDNLLLSLLPTQSPKSIKYSLLLNDTGFLNTDELVDRFVSQRGTRFKSNPAFLRYCKARDLGDSQTIQLGETVRARAHDLGRTVASSQEQRDCFVSLLKSYGQASASNLLSQYLTTSPPRKTRNFLLEFLKFQHERGARDCAVSQLQVAEALGIAQQSVSEALARLEASGEIICVERNKNPQVRKANLYRLKGRV